MNECEEFARFLYVVYLMIFEGVDWDGEWSSLPSEVREKWEVYATFLHMDGFPRESMESGG